MNERCGSDVVRIVEPLIRGYKVPDLSKPAVADPVDHHKVLGSSKRTIPRSVLNDFFCESAADARKFLKRGRVCRIDVDELRAMRNFRRNGARGCEPSGSAGRENAERYQQERYREQVWEVRPKHFHNYRAMSVCKMLKVSMLQRFELTNFVEMRHFSTDFVEKPSLGQ